MVDQQAAPEESDRSGGTGVAVALPDDVTVASDARSPDGVSPDVVAQSLGAAYWWVDDCRWASVQPALTDDLVELLAPPILVCAAPVPPAGACSSRSVQEVGR